VIPTVKRVDGILARITIKYFPIPILLKSNLAVKDEKTGPPNVPIIKVASILP